MIPPLRGNETTTGSGGEDKNLVLVTRNDGRNEVEHLDEERQLDTKDSISFLILPSSASSPCCQFINQARFSVEPATWLTIDMLPTHNRLFFPPPNQSFFMQLSLWTFHGL